MSVPDIIDVHVHLCRDRAQEKAVFPRPGYPDEWFWANPEGIIPYMDKEGLSHVFVTNYIDTNGMVRGRLSKMKDISGAQLKDAEVQLRSEMMQRLKAFNTWAVELSRQQPRLLTFVCVDIGLFHDEKTMMTEMDGQVAAGAKGVFLVPGISRFLPGDRRMYPLYDLCQQKGIPILSDSGSLGGVRDGVVYGEPVKFVPVIKDFPRLKFIMASACSAYWDERIEIAADFPHVYFETAGGFYSPGCRARDGQRACSVEDAVRFIRKIGAHRILFGSDAPGSEPRQQFQQIMGLPLTDQEKRQILAENASEFIGIQ